MLFVVEMLINVYVDHRIINGKINAVEILLEFVFDKTFPIDIARAVGYDCTDDSQCGIGMCKAKRCDCKGGQRVENLDDSNGRPIQRCRNGKILLLNIIFLSIRNIYT